MMLGGILFLLLLKGKPEMCVNGAHIEVEVAPHEQEDYPGDQFNQTFEGSGNNSLSIEMTDYQENFNQTDGSAEENRESSEDNCNYQSILNHLNLTQNKDLYTMVRPTHNHSYPTDIYLQMRLYGILDLREKDQAFVSCLWISMGWFNGFTWWLPEDFCGLREITIPTKELWKPDLKIEEMIEKNKAVPNPYLNIRWYGMVNLKTEMVIVSSCRMRVYKFPFDVQRCNLTFKSAIYSDKELVFHTDPNATRITELSRKVMHSQYEWLFINMTPTEKTVDHFGYNQSVIVYTVHMKRRSVLYIANFMVPILFFLSLDLTSFLISDRGGEKLSFKITVMLAVTVMQLILNDILPASSNRVPLIAVYCIGIFGLMMMSLLETILVMYLIAKDDKAPDNEANEDQSLSADCSALNKKKKWAHCACICNMHQAEPSSDQLSTKEESSCQMTEEAHVLGRLSDELKQVQNILSSKKKQRKPGYWNEMTKKINKVFFIVYVMVATVFLLVVFSKWLADDE